MYLHSLAKCPRCFRSTNEGYQLYMIPNTFPPVMACIMHRKEINLHYNPKPLEPINVSPPDSDVEK